MDVSVTPVTQPLSSAQTEVWLAQQLHPDSPVYNIAQYTVIDGVIDATVFEAALRQVINEADTLRLQFVDSDDGLRQRIGTPAWSIPVLDLTTQADPQAAAQAWMRTDYEQLVDLVQGSLFQYALLKVAPEQWFWYQRYHHIMMDGHGQYLIAQRVAHVYSALCAGNEPASCTLGSVLTLLESDAQYQSSAQREKDEAYWLKHCAHWPEPATLANRAAPALQQRLRQTTYLATQALGDTALDASRLTQFMTAAMAAYLYRFTGEQDVVLGLPVKARFGADRHIPSMKSNTLPLRLTIRPGMSLSSFMQQAAQAMQSGLRHQRYPSEALRRLLGLPAGQRLFGIKVNVMPFDYALSFGGHSSTSHNLLAGPVEDLMLNVYWTPNSRQLRIDFDANPGCYTAEMLDAHERRFIRSMQVLAADATQSIDSIDLLDADERYRLLVEWNATQRDYPSYLCMHQLFEAQVERTPEAVALVYEDQTFSYAQLNAQANRLAHQLIELGVKPDTRVAICMQRSAALVVGLLAILKAGGAYVPLDPSYPNERLAHILADAAPNMVLADAAGRAALGEAALASCTVLDPATLPALPDTNPSVAGLTARHLAYVIYTSGSTGMPKGVMVEHAQVVRLFEATQPWYGFNEHDTWCLFHSFAFDFSVWELWGALRYGGKLVIVPHSIARSADAFYQLICEQGVTVLNQTPSAFKALMASQVHSALSDQLRYVILGGEALEPTLLQAWYATHDERHPQLVNMYGLTEATVHVTYRPLRQQDSKQAGNPIGVRIPDLKIYLLDEHGQPVPLGAMGELYIGGAGVARGYLNRPELTAERFVPDPFSDEAEARLYKTGDVARYLPDGNLEYVGRNDEQVKIRGFRIEPGEIAACLTAHPQVRDAVVVATGEGSAKRLVAYVQAEADEPLASTLRAQVAARLPEYMVPSAFVRLDAFPLTSNGKLDRRALPAPDDEALAHRAYEAPQGELETTLAAIWAELLGVERVGRHDSFFALGGHSLLAVQLMNRVRMLGADVPLATLFATPTLAAFAAAFEVHLQQGTEMLPEITPVSREGSLPLSFAQQRLWFLAQLDGTSESYHIPLALHVRGPLDRAAWQQALDALLARHEALRSTFVSVEGQPQVQLLPADRGVPLRWHDLRGVPDTQAQLARLSHEAAHAPFDLAQGPLIHACGIQVADDEYVMLLTQHHIVSDGWSIGVLVRELNALYMAACRSQPDPLPPLAVQYPDYAAWQRQWLTGERLQAQSDYWRATLADAPVLLELPTDRPRPAQQSFAGAHVSVQIDVQTTRALKRLSGEHGTTLFMTVLAAWSVVLSRLSGQHDVVIGTPSANRNHRQIESLIGFFVNTLALRVDLSGELDTSELLARVRRTTLDAQAHQDLPFEQVVEIVQPPRRLDHTPLFQVMLAWQNNEPGEWRLPGLTATPAELEYDIAKFDLELNLSEAGDEIIGSLGYATALFERSTIERHVGYLQTMLRAMVACPQQLVATLELLSPAERQLLLSTWNATQQAYPKHRCVHQLFEAQVERTPEAPALVFEDQTLSYAQLNAQANRFAHQLIELGVKPDVRVAISVQRSVALVVGVLAILKAGGAYVPLDPSYPGERLAHILADAAPNIVLADAAGRAAVGEAALASCTVLDPAILPAWPDTNPSVVGLTARHLAYVIYTSGSTGTPKGVMVEHAQTVNFLCWAVQTFTPLETQHTLFATSISFDLSVYECFVPLAQGSTVHLVKDALVLMHQTQPVSLINTVPFALQSLLAHRANLSSATTINVAGEPLTARFIKQIFEQTPIQRLCNLYGPSESTTYSTWRPMQRGETLVESIGRPIANTRVYLLDAHGQPVPLGAVGELYIGGAGVARGYLNRPALTAERFVPDPFSDDAGARLYKTGDLARYRPDGNLEYLGRNDEQVKIRGFRIEPGEIEACLTAHPQVRDAVVLATGEGQDKRLVAYVVAQPDEALVSTLRAHVSARLPEYMIPSAFVRLDAWPLTPNGKLDRHALPAPDDEALAHQAYEAPQGELETTLATIWAELLGVERVGRHDSFFALGGHSLLAVQLIERLRCRGLSVSVRLLFEAPTLSALAQTLGQRRDVVVPPNVITPDTTAITPSMLPLIELTQADIDRIVKQVPGGVANIQDIYALSPLQDGLLFHHLLAPDSDPYLLMVQLAFDSRERLDQYLHALQQVIDRHDILRTAFVWEGVSTPAQVVWRYAQLPVTKLTLDAADGPIAEQLTRRFDPRHTRLELTQAPLLHCAIAQDSEGRWLLMQRLHHLIIDHSTLEVMHAEVRAFIEGRGDTLLPARPFRHLVAQARLGVSQAEHEHFFTELLADVEPTLPFGLAQVQGDGSEVSESHRMLPQALNDRLRAYARRLGVSLASLCHLAWAQVLARASGQQRVVFGTVLFGRMQAGEGADSAMGLFINTLPLRVDLDGSVQACVRSTHARLAALLEHEHASLALAQRCSGVPADTPLFSALFNYRHNAMGLDERSGLPGVELLSAQERTNYPIGLSVDDDGQSLGLTAQSVPSLEPERVCVYMQQALHSLADALEATPDTAVQQLQVLPEAERELLLNTWNATQQAYPSNWCVHQLFEAQVERTPDATALVYEDQTFSYAQLNAQANRLAHQLIELGVKPDVRVAICMQRSAALVVGLLAILKAGGAYVPLDPSYPGERLVHILADAGPNMVLVDAAGRAALGEAALASCTVLDPATLPALPDTNPSVAGLTARHLAYVIYTSGSTGMPKGVMVEHAQVVRLFEATQPWYGFNEHDTWCLFHSFAFDFSVWELWGALRYGGKLVIVPHSIARSADAFYQLICEQGVTVLNQTPSAFKALMASQVHSALSDQLRYVILGGEALEPTLLQAWYATHDERHPQLVNMYGLTEATVHVTYRPLRQQDSKQAGNPIGVRIPDLKIYLLDEHGQPVPLGAMGELYIGGAGVARGYLNRPALTAERFVPDPFSEDADARLYKTGDVARYRPDGNLEYLGRNDEQVKIRGFRIEPGEIAACLTAHPQVREAVVLALGEGQNKRLVAYVVADPDDALSSTLRAQVAAALPEYMVPSAFVRLDAFPLTPNGKLDRRALPAPDDAALARQAYEAPQGELETTLAVIWAELLGVERVGRHDSFFALGGHSLLAVQLIERLRRQGVGLSVRALFDTPTLSALAQTLGQRRDVVVPANVITPDTTAITPSMLSLIELTQADIDKIVEQVPQGVANIQDIYALSPLQDGLLFHHLLSSTGDPYLLMQQLAFDTRERLDQYLYALQQVIDRHDMLRTAFVWEGLSMPAQVVWRHARLPVTELTLDAADGPIAEQLARRFDPRHTRLDLTQAPLLHCAIAQDSEGRWLLMQRLHHLIIDHSTMEVMYAEVRAFIEGRGDMLPPAQPFRDLVAQAKLGVSQAEHERFFTEQLADIEEPTLPFGLAQVQRDGSEVSESYRMLPSALNDRLREHARRLGVSLASLCHLAWAQVLARASDQSQVVFGTVLFGRMQAGSGADRAMGLFINTLPLRVDLDGSVRACVRSTHARLAVLLEHEHASLALAQRCSGVPADTPLFSALLNYRHNAMDSSARSGLPGVELLSAQERTNYPLTLSVEDFGQSLGLTAQSVPSLEPERVCAYMQQALHSLADALEATPDTAVQQLQVLPEAERQLLLDTWNATQQAYPSHLCIHQLFEAQVEHTPEAPALVFKDQTLSYAQLNAQANRLAHQLIEGGVKPDARVAICVQRSAALVVGLLAILKAGGAYVPLDPSYPSERLTHILADAAPKIVLADAAGRAVLGDAALAECTVLDPTILPALPDTNPSVAGLTARHLAYVIYTSGSTGMPKGVMVEHAQVVRLFEATQPWYGFNEHDTWCLFHSFAFDFSVWELWGALRYGGKLVIVPHSIARSADAFYQLICEQGVTVLNQTPSAFKALMASQAHSAVSDQLRYVILGGEALEPTSLQAWYATHDERHPQLINMYGITEATVHVTYRPLRQQDSEQAGSPVGTRIPDLTIYLLDAHGQPVPLGAVGELYIGGAGVARGYLNRPALTAERFVPDPFSIEPDARLYKTGDVARYRPDGNLEFLGRNDEQVKIRGFRIEPGEIAACLTAHPQVHDAVVLATGEGSAKRLVAYVQAEADEPLASTLRAKVAARLPEYMVPSAFVRLDAFPLTPNGKLDRRALPAPDDAALARQAYEAPQGELETTLAAIWAELLGVKQVGRHDSFFALGGHSLLAVQLIERLRRRGIGLSVRALFDMPVLSALARSLGQHCDVVVPPNVITPDTSAITPSMLPLIELTQADIDKIVEQVPQGVANIQDIYALSPLQDGLLFHHLLSSTGDPYLLMQQLAFDTRARLDQYLHALQQVIDRHDILRTAFVWEGLSMPAQVVWRHARLPVTELTLDAADGPIAEQLARRFDPRHTRLALTQAPLLHGAIAQDNEGRWLLMQRLHHLIIDHSTLEVMHAEVRAFIEGRGDMLPPAQPFRDLVAQARLGVSQAEHEHFFTELLADVEPTLPFGLAQVQHDGSEVSESRRMLPPALNDQLRVQAKRLGVSLASLCHLAWAQVLARASGQQRVVLGTVLFGRMQAGEGADRAMGLFINTLPLRVDLDGSVQAAVHATHARLAALLEHEHASLALAQRCSGVPAGTPLFSALFNYRHNAMDSSARSGLPGVELLSAQERTNYPLTLSVEDFGQALGLTAQSVPSLDPERVCAYMQQALHSLADALEATPDTAVQQLQVLPEAERELLLNTWNATQQAYPKHRCVHQLFEAQVEHTPEAPALVFKDQTLSYAQLNTQANRLAHQLIELGVRPDARVAICVQRSAALVVGLLAILKAGGAYVPLDRSYPGERLAHILADAAPKIVLADAAGRAALGEAALASCTVLDPATLPALPDTNPSVAALTARHLAYVIYTSGSTGTPKGVMVPHRAIARLVINNDFVDIGTDDRVAFAANPAFDASTFEVWAPLLNGATVVVIDHDTVLMPAAFAHTLREQRISILWLTVGLFNQMAAQVGTAFSQLKTLIVGGDVLDARWVAQVMRESPPEQLINGYGPTESTTFATTYKITSVPGRNASIPIGRPIANTCVYLLDAYGQPVPLGAVGELYLGGAGVAHGYLNRPALTAERFVPDPFSEDADARLYKTGDLARYRPDGNLEFVGRNDDQVKIRGFRIEPGEIAACLIQHPQVRDAVVLATGEGSDKRLVAYVQAEADEQLASTLRAQMAARLPEYMVPSAFVRLDAWPLTPNGKLDRRALPAPDDAALAHQAYEAPQGELEATLAEIWAELLGVKQVGRHDSFFALGGHSLLAVRLMNRVRWLGADVPLATLFATPTLAAFAAALEAHWQQGPDTLPEITPVSREGSLPLSFAQQRLWFLAQLDGVSDTYHIPLALHVRGPLDRAAWQQALDALLARHEALRSTFVSVEGKPQVQLLPADTGVPLRWHDLRGEPDAQAQLARLRHEAAHAPFDLAQGPLIHACGIQVADDEHVVLLTQHHIVSDGWSIGVLTRELSALYAASVGAQADPLPPLAVQYPDYAAWQRQWLTGERLQAQSDYWRAKLADAPVLLELPTNRPRPAQQSFAGAQVPVRIDASTTQALKHLSGEHGTTLFMTVLAAWSAVLARLSGQCDVVIGTPSANRNHRQIEPLIGFFVNTLALRVDLSDEPDTAELLARARRTTLDAQAHQDLPFEQVVEIVQPPRRLNHTPLFQVMLAWQNHEPGEWRLPGLTATSAELEYDAVKFDLELHLSEAGEEIIGSLGYATALFERSTIERHVGYLQTMLRAMVARPKQPVATLQILGPNERQLLLQTWNATQQAYPSHWCVHQLFEAQVEHTPDATALVYEDQTFSYAQLNAQANRLAHQLIELGVKPDTRVAICVERSPALVVGLLAILKAGGAYVPLDPAYPGERLAYILADAAPTIVLADAAGRAALGEAALASCTVLDPATLPAWPDTNPSVAESTARHLAYVIYTSGSTGTPKGVMVPHHAIARLVINNDFVDIGTDDRVAFAANPAFDASTFEVWAPLLNGATVVVIDHDTVLMPAAFAHTLREQRISILWLTVGLFNQMAAQVGTAFSQLKTLIVGGDVLDARWVAQVMRESPPEQLINGYGPTESTTFATTYKITSVPGRNASIPIGRPIANTCVYLLDAHGQSVPLGAVGELYLGGAGVARGYLNRPALTAERFVPDPFSSEADARLYKTGDLARYRPDGNLEFVGRNDEQVKIRGFRIEPGEIAACLTAHPQVRDAVVLATGEGSDKRLVAYVQAEADEALASTLRAQVAASLPEYMMPSAFVRLDAFPLTPNGKLDRRALPEPDDAALAHQAYEAPQGELETTLAAIWAELLGVERVGRHDSFFVLGGHSLLAMRLMSRVRNVLGVELAIRTLFEAPTLAGLARHLVKHDKMQGDSFSVLLPLKPTGSRPALFCIHPGLGLSWSYMGLSNYLPPDQPLYGLQARGFDGASPLASTLDEMVSDYLEQMRCVQPKGPYCLLGWSLGGNVAHSMAVRLEHQGEKVALLALLDSSPFAGKAFEEQGNQVDQAMVREVFAAHYGNELVSAMDERLLENTEEIAKNNVRIVRDYSPSQYGGDALLFRATVAEAGCEPLVKPDAWRPYVLGKIEVHDVHCSHGEMLKPEPTAAIASILACKLDKWESQQAQGVNEEDKAV
ncbi:MULTISPECIES: non-ribosomal peptide synthetase [Burkholderiaceae]|uniref:non-ribosomal peptide synthetase n=6 Tax=Burkholderiales TaxID=80840 RepID=UPI0009625076|nr:non-ribosomal peptide synthetase [Burkholderia sp. b14]SIT65154.1 amino acid adenylation domain-containing protein [Burkholderia sp. b14]